MKHFFYPQSIAVVGASDKVGSLGHKVMENLLASYQGQIIPINIAHDEVMGKKAYPTLKKAPIKPDLVVITLRAPLVLDIMEDCVKVGVDSAVVISSGFRQKKAKGKRTLEDKLMHIARKGNVRVLGPNCIGLMSPHTGLNASIARSLANPGNIAFISQSGALCDAILDWGKRENVGFSHFISVGDMADINWGDLILHLGDDPHTQAILLHMETIGNVSFGGARQFISAAREVAYTKPIIVIKGARTEAAAQAAASHTGTLTGRDALFDAAFRRSGVLRVGTIAELFYMSSLLGKQPAPVSNRLAIVSNAGGPAVLATDALVKGGGQIAELSAKSKKALQQIPQLENVFLQSPLDIRRDANMETFQQALKIALEDSCNDGVLGIVTPQALLNIEQAAEQLLPLARKYNKPFIISLMGGELVREQAAKLTQAGIPTFTFPDTSARMFNLIWRHAYNIRGIYETPRMPMQMPSAIAVKEKVAEKIQQVRAEGRKILSEWEAKEILKAYSLPIIETHLALSEEDAVAVAEQMGYPVVMKVHSTKLIHKARLGGVMLNLLNKKSVHKAYQSIKKNIIQKRGEESFEGVTVQQMYFNSGLELLIGSQTDEQFGPAIHFGNGGRMAELYRDKALGLPPLNTTLARRMMEQTQLYHTSQAIHHISAAQMEEVEQLLVQFSQLVIEQPFIKEIDLNPLAVSENGICILDAHILLQGKDVAEEDLPPVAIRPYPVQYDIPWVMKNGEEVDIRPLRPEDELLFPQFHRALSDESVYYRYFHSMSYDFRVSHERLARICFIDYDRELALAVLHEGKDGRELLGVGRIVKFRTKNQAEFSITIGDQLQGMGLGTELLRRLISIAHDEQLDKLVADILPENQAMRAVCEKVGFKTRLDMEEQVVKAVYEVKKL